MLPYSGSAKLRQIERDSIFDLLEKKGEEIMRKRVSLVLAVVLSVTMLFAGCGTKNETKKNDDSAKTVNTKQLEMKDYVADYAEIDEALTKETNHTLEEAQVIKNPYGNSPLTAVICFTTDKKVGGTITVEGKKEKDNITGEVKEATTHIIPVYGLYNNDTTKVHIELSDGSKKTFEIQTEDCGLDLDIKADKIDTKSYDYDKLTLMCSTVGGLYAIDSEGDIRWFFNDGGTLGVKFMENGHLIIPVKYAIKPQYYKSGLKEIDFLGKVYNEYAIPGGHHHGTYIMPDGNLLVSSDANDLTSVEDNIKKINYKTGEVMWECDMRELFPGMECNSASIVTDGSEEIDWCHNNGVAYDEENNLVLLSCRHLDAIVAVKMEEKPSIAWILGDPNDWPEEYSKYFFTPEGDDFEWFYAQHNISILDNGDLLLFDNGTAKVKRDKNDERVTGDDVYSRAVAYHIDTEKMTVNQTWQYGKERGGEWYADWISGANSISGDTSDVWITAGSNLYDPATKSYDGNPIAMFKPGIVCSTHVSHVVDNKLAYEFKVTGGVAALTFRSMLIDMYQADYVSDREAKGTFLGSLGEKKTADADKFEVKDAPAMPEGTTVALDPTKLTVNASYALEEYDAEKTKLKGSYVVLVDTDGNQKAYALGESAAADKDADGKATGSATVTVSGYTTPDGLEGKYDVYVVIGGTVYNTGNYVEFNVK